MTKPLEGLLVVTLEQAVAAPYLSRLLAEGGARVIKLERPEGDFARAYDSVVHGQSAYFVWLNSGKESVVVDLRRPADLELVRNMLRRADVFVQNLKPGAVERLGLGYAALAADNSELVMCSISGYGREGEYAQMKAYDALIQAETGLCSVTGPPGSPSKVGASIVDIATGLTGYGEVVKALFARSRGAGGAHVEVPMFGVMAEWLAVPLAYYEFAGKLLGGTGLDHGQIAPYGAFAAADGPIFLVVQNQREWTQLCRDGLGRPELAEDPRYATNADRMEHRDELRADIEAVFASQPRAVLAERLTAAGIACGSINTIEDLARHPALTRKQVAVDGTPASLAARVGDCLDNPAVPALDEHGDALRKEFT
ncbi:MAG: CaiB/BaiF CoA transferase family protein [Gammaproteobacteria bacterium]